MNGKLSAAEDPKADLRALARALYDCRRARDDLFGESRRRLLGEPAWDLLLDLFARGRGMHTSVLAGCIGSATATSTALRRIRKLEESGLLQRDRDASDARRSWLNLTEAGEALVAHTMETARGILGGALLGPPAPFRRQGGNDGAHLGN